jgi:hypothetical protein
LRREVFCAIPPSFRENDFLSGRVSGRVY